MVRVTRQSTLWLQLLFCFGLASFYFYDYLLRVLPSVISRGIIEAYDLSFLSFGRLCAAYYFIYVPMQLLIGLLVDRYQLIYLTTLALLLSALGCCLFANAHYALLAEIGRIVMGVGAGFIFIILLKAVTEHIIQKQFTFFIGTVMGIGMSGGLITDMTFVFIARSWGWRLSCYLISFAGLIFTALSLWYFFRDRKTSYISGILPTWREDINNIKMLLKDRQLWINCVIGAALYLPISGFVESWGIRYLNEANQLSSLSASIAMSLFFLGFAIGAPILGWCYDRTRQYQMILTSGAVGMTILISIVLYVPDLSAFTLAIYLFALGFCSASLIIIFALNQEKVEVQNVGKVFGMTNFVIMLAGGAAWLIGLFIHCLAPYARINSLINATSKYQLAFLILPTALLFAVFLSFYVRDAKEWNQ